MAALSILELLVFVRRILFQARVRNINDFAGVLDIAGDVELDAGRRRRAAPDAVA